MLKLLAAVGGARIRGPCGALAAVVTSFADACCMLVPCENVAPGEAPKRFPVVGVVAVDGSVEGVGRSKRGGGGVEEIGLIAGGGGAGRGCRGLAWVYRETSAVATQGVCPPTW